MQKISRRPFIAVVSSILLPYGVGIATRGMLALQIGFTISPVEVGLRAASTERERWFKVGFS